MIDDSEKKSILDKILQSSEFEHSRKNSKLLSYLVEQSIKNISPKETSIAFDVFDKNAEFNPNEDTTVRVNIFHLRKKLDKYYEKEGKKDKFRIDIPLGHYAVKFVQNNHKLAIKRKSFSFNISVFLTVLLICCIGYLIYLKLENSKLHQHSTVQGVEASQHPIWENVLNSSFPTIIVLGELYFFDKYDATLKTWLNSRMHAVMSDEDLNKLQESYPGGQFKPKPNNAPSYFAMNSVWPLADIIPVLVDCRQPFHLQRSSKIRPKELMDNNIIFMGSYQSLIHGLFKDVSQKTNFSFDIMNESIVVKADSGQKTSVYNPTESFRKSHKDYCIVKKLPGPNKNIIYLISSFSATGTTGAAEYLANSTSLSELSDFFIEKYNFFPEYFEIIFEVSGYERSHFDTKLVEFRIIKSDINLW